MISAIAAENEDNVFSIAAAQWYPAVACIAVVKVGNFGKLLAGNGKARSIEIERLYPESSAKSFSQIPNQGAIYRLSKMGFRTNFKEFIISILHNGWSSIMIILCSAGRASGLNTGLWFRRLRLQTLLGQDHERSCQ